MRSVCAFGNDAKPVRLRTLVSAQIEGSVEAAAKSEVDRAKIRTVLGSRTQQEAILK